MRSSHAPIRLKQARRLADASVHIWLFQHDHSAWRTFSGITIEGCFFGSLGIAVERPIFSRALTRSG